jgi:hypothetical protein
MDRGGHHLRLGLLVSIAGLFDEPFNFRPQSFLIRSLCVGDLRNNKELRFFKETCSRNESFFSRLYVSYSKRRCFQAITGLKLPATHLSAFSIHLKPVQNG